MIIHYLIFFLFNSLSISTAQGFAPTPIKIDVGGLILFPAISKPQFKLCDKLNPKFIIIIGEEERISGNLSVKNSLTKTQELVNVEKIIDYIKKYI